MQELTCEIIEKLIDIADKHNCDRDDVLKKLSHDLEVLSLVATLREYKRKSEVEE